jgi:hypothetical protein
MGGCFIFPLQIPERLAACLKDLFEFSSNFDALIKLKVPSEVFLFLERPREFAKPQNSWDDSTMRKHNIHIQL